MSIYQYFYVAKNVDTSPAIQQNEMEGSQSPENSTDMGISLMLGNPNIYITCIFF